jgi:hypothetical protein
MLLFVVMEVLVAGAGQLLLDTTSVIASRTGFTADNGSGQCAGFSPSNVTNTTNVELTWVVVCVDINGASSAIYLNGTQEGGTQDSGTDNLSTLRVGDSRGAAFPFQGLVGEIRIYTNPQAGDIASITSTLRSKWGI